GETASGVSEEGGEEGETARSSIATHKSDAPQAIYNDQYSRQPFSILSKLLLIPHALWPSAAFAGWSQPANPAVLPASPPATVLWLESVARPRHRSGDPRTGLVIYRLLIYRHL
ncbi:hypothetical protein PMAYCL1PPCAC_04207, partial [Pristionchus mayeri]